MKNKQITEALVNINENLNQLPVTRSVTFSVDAFDVIKTIQRMMMAETNKDISVNRVFSLVICHYGKIINEGSL